MWLIIEVQRAGLVHLLQLLPVPEVQSKVSGNDGFADDLQHVLVLAGAQGGEDVVPFQLQETQTHSTSHKHRLRADGSFCYLKYRARQWHVAHRGHVWGEQRNCYKANGIKVSVSLYASTMNLPLKWPTYTSTRTILFFNCFHLS